jgi:hypothetical protein
MQLMLRNLSVAGKAAVTPVTVVTPAAFSARVREQYKQVAAGRGD